MSTVRELHHQAMALAQQALVARESGALDEAALLAGRALPFEVQAAERLARTPENKPTRAILYRSAASLAYQGGDFATARHLIAEGLSGYPPPRIKRELQKLYEQIDNAGEQRTRASRATAPTAAREQLRGVLDFADARDGDSLGLTTDDDKTYTIHVVAGIDDLVRTYFKCEVTIVAEHHDGELILVAIQGADS